MWKDYSSSYLKGNRASGISVIIAAFISALLLSLLGSLFYNLWYYEIERIKWKEGDWQGRLVGEISSEDLALMESYANVESLIINEELSVGQEKTVDLYFKNMRTILTDMPQIARLVGLPPEAVSYHYMLLNMYLIRDPADPAPRLIFPFFLALTVMACISLILIIHNSFAVSMNDRIHQFGILSSIGATPRQIRTCLLQEAAILCALPVLLGNLLGILISMGILNGINILLDDVTDRLKLPFTYHPLILLCSLLAAIVTIWISAWIPARKMSRLTPLEAIKNTGEFQLKRKKKSPVLSLLFGIEGELAGNALKAQRKALRTATFSLTFSFLAFVLSMCFFSLTKISQRMTYFEKYQDVWDVMVTIQQIDLDAFDEIQKLQEISGVESAVLYQKAQAKRFVSEEEISEEMLALKGFEHAPEEYVSTLDHSWLVNAPLVILDDLSFLAYCEEIGATPQLNGAIILNQTRDFTNPNFRERDILPYLKGTQKTTVLCQTGQEDFKAELPVLAYTQEAPALREEYGTLDFYELVHFLPVSVWKEIKGEIGGLENEAYIRILAREGTTLAELNELEEKVSQILGTKYEAQIENRIQEKQNNDDMYNGMMLILGGFCTLLAMIGLGNVFSNTLGFVRQRRREFARYLSIGLTPEGMRKMFCIEALVIAGRPVLITLPLTVISIGYMLKLSYLDPFIFIQEAPVIPILIFLFVLLAFVALAYYLGGKKLLHSSLIDALRDDTMI